MSSPMFDPESVPKVNFVSDRSAEVVMLVSNRLKDIGRSRMDLVEGWLENGWDVIVAASGEESKDDLKTIGTRVESVPFARGGFSPVADLRAFVRLVSLYREYRPCLVHLFNAKANVLGSLAARLTGVEYVVNTITGLGRTFKEDMITRTLSGFGFRLMGSSSDRVLFQNPDDMELFNNRGFVSIGKSSVILSSGVNTERFKPSWDDSHGPVTVALVTRMLWSKGVGDFVELAREFSGRGREVEFVLGGAVEENHPDHVSLRQLTEWDESGVVNYVGYVEDMPGFFAGVDLFVYPGTYREGVPRVVLEAAASGVPAIVRNVPGSREAVRDGETGYVVDSNGLSELKQRVAELVHDSSRRSEMGRQARERAVNRFDRTVVLRQTLEVYEELLAG